MAMHPIKRLADLGQSVWLDYLDHDIVASRELERLIADDGILGLTSNPTILQKSIASTSAYDAFLQDASRHESDGSLFERIAVSEVGRACDAFAEVYRRASGADGYVSIEVSPELAHDAAGSRTDALRLHAAINRPNVMVKIPGTREGLVAIAQVLGAGVNVNVTLLFAVERYVEVAQAYLGALEARVAAKEPIDRLASVASFFISRIDTKVDRALDALANDKARERGRALRGRIAIANAQRAYAEYRRIFSPDSARWARLAERGARPQRVLWASTSPRDPAYRDVYYAEALVGAGTIDTMNRETLQAYRDHGEPQLRLEPDDTRARAQMSELAQLGVDMAQVTRELEDEGVRAFARSYEEARVCIAGKRRVLIA